MFFVYISCTFQNLDNEGMRVTDDGVSSAGRAQFLICCHFSPLNKKRRLLYLKTQFVPRTKHFSSRL